MAALALPLGGPAAANTCGATVVDPAMGLYVVVDDALLPDTVSVWIYQESNGFPGLQRNDDVCPAPEGTSGDTVIF